MRRIQSRVSCVFRRTFITSLILVFAHPSFACSVLSHEALVDALWGVKLRPILLEAYPQTTPEQLKLAHGYAYGGAVIQDLGYYPHGSEFFSDLTHYVRTGDFIVALIKEAREVNELAFALGALSHYAADVDVHRLATNPGEAILYPRVKRKFGPVVTYEQDPAAHLKTEFGFDVLEVARGNYAPEAYHNFIGFYVAGPVLNRAFQDVYGLQLTDIFSDFDKSIGSYRRAVSNTIPMATRIAWAERAHDIHSASPGMTRRKFVYVMNRSSYEHDWGKQYDQPSTRDQIAAVLLRLLPPIGPLRALHYKMPTPAVEKLFMQSFDKSARQYAAQLESVSIKTLQLEDRNYDLGEIAPPAGYGLEDKAYARWVDQLSRKRYQTVTPEISNAVLSYYKNLDAPFQTKKKPTDWTRLIDQLNGLKQETLRASR